VTAVVAVGASMIPARRAAKTDLAKVMTGWTGTRRCRTMASVGVCQSVVIPREAGVYGDW